MKKLNNKTLGIVLMILVVVFILTKIFRSPMLESNVHTNFLQIDTTSLTEIQIHPQVQRGTEITLKRNGNVWEVAAGNKSAEVPRETIRDALVPLIDMRVTRLVSKKKSDQGEYQVNDTSGTHVVALAGKEVLADFWIGGAGTGSGPYRQTTSYLRLNNKQEIYEAQAGYLATSFNKAYNDWRDHVFIHLDKKKIKKVVFQYPADSGYTLSWKDSVWMIGSQRADSSKTAILLSRLSFKRLTDFADDFKPDGAPDISVTIRDSISPLAQIQAWGKDTSWILTSSQRKGIYFKSPQVTIDKQMFVSKSSLLPQKPAN
jgi:hypothetical protein